MYVLRAEDNADLLALELLAPQSLVSNWLYARGITWTDTAVNVGIHDILIRQCGLPKRIAKIMEVILSARIGHPPQL
jgi:hypothetical protein